MTLSRAVRKCSSRCKIRSRPYAAAADVRQYPARVLSWRRRRTGLHHHQSRCCADRRAGVDAIDNALAYKRNSAPERAAGERTRPHRAAHNVVRANSGDYRPQRGDEQCSSRMVAQSDSTVLISAKPAPAKSLSPAIHNLSGRNGRRMVKELRGDARRAAESDLFGHERGAFTGPAPSVSAASNWRTKAPCSSMKWAICR
ncbi:sigma 54-interacting transcriptional regulator [Klebsiella pneumoniae]|uniref:Sigma 54-interacting transcriptional regulator n=1 Tax=Klebsiella pneumoniae TaxID=573 RepID=A0A939NMN3_KLEPN|nr:sigma 54-interacting transcriptional regulator [Klebsiella pneumoniae]